MRKGLLALCCCLYAVACSAQKSYGIGQDYYVYRKGSNVLVPSVYYQTQKGWFGQARYNYEADQTLSLHAGKTFSKKGRLPFVVTPMAGVLAGRFNGGGFGVQTQVAFKKLGFYTEPQYCFSFGKGAAPFYYNWTELTFAPLPAFYIGAAMQQTKVKGENFLVEPGVMMGLTIRNFDFPVYFFKANEEMNYVVVGLHVKLDK